MVVKRMKDGRMVQPALMMALTSRPLCVSPATWSRFRIGHVPAPLISGLSGRLVTSHVRPRQVSGYRSISQLRHGSFVLDVTIKHCHLHIVVEHSHAMNTYVLSFSLLTISCLHSISTTPRKCDTHPTACVTIAVKLVPLQV